MLSVQEMKKSVHVDKNQLDIACAEQSDLMFDAMAELVEYQGKLRELENRKELLHSSMMVEIKRDPLSFNLDVATDKTAEAVIRKDDKYQGMLRTESQLIQMIEMLRAYIKSLDQRKSMIEGLITLHGQSYFASVRNAVHAPRSARPVLKKQNETGPNDSNNQSN